MALAMAPGSIKYEFESVLYDITPENSPTNPSPNPCLIIQLRYTHRWVLKFQSEDDDKDEEFIEDVTPEFSFLFCIPLDRLNEGGYISHVLERDYGLHLQPCECDYLKVQISAFAPSLLLGKSDIKHQVIHMTVVLQVTKVEYIRDEEFTESDNQHDDNEEFTADNFSFLVSV